MKPQCIFASIAAAALSTSIASAGPTCPNEFEDPNNALSQIYAFFGGVTAWGTTPSNTTIHSGKSLEVWANLIDDSFSAAGFAVGTFGISAPNLNVPANATTFSITVKSPTNGQLSLKVTLREDDNGDGVINSNSTDDQWESLTYMLLPGVSVYNIPLSAFQDLNPGTGNDVQNFTTTGRLAYFLTFESRDSYPGGQIVGPVSLLIDHLGLFDGPQSIPTSGNPADITGDGMVNVNDLLAVINAWGSCPAPPESCSADIAPAPDGDGNVDVTDLLSVINNWGS